MNRISRFYLALSVVFTGLFFLSLTATAQNGFKLGAVDTQKVFEGYKKAQEANELLKTAQERLRGQLKGLEGEILTMEERLTKQKLFLKETETATLENDIRLKKQEYQRELEAGQDSLMEKQKELVEPILDEIEGLIQQIGKSESYSLILEKRLVTLYVDPKYDLTESVLKSLNAQYDQEKANPDKKDSKPSVQSSATPPKKQIKKEGDAGNK